MANTKLTTKFQTTIPKEIREKLGLSAGDVVQFEVLKDGTVVLRKADPLDLIYAKSLNATLKEWESKEDDEAFSDLQDI